VEKIQDGLSTFDPATQTVTTDGESREASKATGFATPTDVADAQAAIITQGDLAWSTYDGSDTPGTTTLLSRIVGTLAAGTHQPQSGDAFARLGAPDGASISADVAETKTVVDEVKVEVGKVPREGHQVTGLNVTPGSQFNGQTEIVRYTLVEESP